MENSGYESSLLVAGIFLLIIISCIVNLIKKGAEESRKRKSELIESKRKVRLLTLLTAIKNQPAPAPLNISAYMQTPSPAPESQHTTSDEIIKEAIAALVKVGHTKTEAKKIVSGLCDNSTFNSSEELLQAAFSK